MEKRYAIIDKIIEYGIYAYIPLMFLSKGEGLRNIIILSIFALWLYSLNQRNNLYLLKTPVSKLCWLVMGATFVSVLFSTDPLYSLLEFKSEPRKFIMLFPVIATVMADKKRLERVVYASFFTALLIAGIGYYSYIVQGMQNVLRPETLLLHIWHNKFATYLNALLPFVFVLFFLLKRYTLKVLFAGSLIFLVLALTLSSSRGGYLSFLSIAFIWSIYMAKTKSINIKKMVLIFVISIVSIGSVSWFFFSSPSFKEKISSSTDIHDINGRTMIWEATIYAYKQKPFTGWGYGKELFKDDKPFIDTPFKKRPLYRESNLPFDDPHNTFLMVLFQQGVVGLIPYLLLILFSIRTFWTGALKTTGTRSYILLACASVLVGNYMVHSMLTILRLQDLAVILGLGMAAIGTDEDSDN